MSSALQLKQESSTRLKYLAYFFLGSVLIVDLVFVLQCLLIYLGATSSRLDVAGTTWGNLTFLTCYGVLFLSDLGYLQPKKFWLGFSSVFLILWTSNFLFSLHLISLKTVLDASMSPSKFIAALLSTPFSKILFALYTFSSIAVTIAGLYLIHTGRVHLSTAKPRFILRRLGINLFLFLLLTPIFIFYTTTTLLTKMSDGFISTHGLALTSEQRIYTKGSSEVVLVPMMHIGKGDFYKKILIDFNQKGTHFLLEGVSDKKNLLKHRPSYSRIAKNFGLVEQKTAFILENTEVLMTSEVADVDMSELQPQTIEILNKVFAIMAAQQSQDSSETQEERKLSSIEADTLIKPLEASSLWSFLSDLIETRNHHVINVMDKTLKKTPPRRIVIPWGALHMKGIETALLERGFQLTDRKTRTILGLHSN